MWKNIDLNNIEKLSEFDDKQPEPGISIVTCCMNRNDNLLRSISSWLKLPVDEIVIVDWSSKTAVSESLARANIFDSRIKILRVNDEPNWILTHGFNVGFRFASHEYIFKFDCDTFVTQDFIQKNKINNNSFIRGNWQEAIDHGLDDQVFINGTFGCNKNTLSEIGYYNEHITTYGWDDTDIYERISSTGLGAEWLSFGTVKHLEQDSDERCGNQQVIKNLLLGKELPTNFNNQRNRFISKANLWWQKDKLQDYSFKCTGDDHVYELKRITYKIEIPEYIMDDAGAYAVLDYFWMHQREIHGSVCRKNVKDLSTFLYFEYDNNVPFSESKNILTNTTLRIKIATSREDVVSGCSDYDYILCLSTRYLRKEIKDKSNILFLPSNILEAVVQSRRSITGDNIKIESGIYFHHVQS